ncbi:MAG: NifB/NifX family molybdenum-iron cluster-binding protein [Endomicrobiaceae bacterium]|jgi:predicted Fe-Mo cluster-binding NifX family protein|nr:NifB/NifX family molybdenum-iron cluster-binding protein [Endomicrobiaceae bacterium]MDD3730406.1 NifB/NifX family molybdenum-iron cluster-binding protein [Endomicrobiaceae bacterium]MDD4165778.1 NifB/NifX family molybdenum-iron cluster-binding protein [Endomicrobiaceae bacterium]
MKIIIPVESKNADAPVCPSFGRTPFFMLFDTETQKSDFIDNAAANSQGGAGIKAAQTLVDSGAKILITYRCGQNAADVLNAGGIKIYKAENGSANDNIKKYKEEKLSVLTDIHPGFHNHGGKNK